MDEIITHSPDETKKIGRNFSLLLIKNSIKKSIIFLEGGLGAGKTVFVKGFADGLGIKESIISPTFVFVIEYTGILPLYHFDLYRIKNVNELDELGFSEYLDKRGFVLIEWAEKVENYAKPSIRINIEKVSEWERKINIEILEGELKIDERNLYQ